MHVFMLFYREHVCKLIQILFSFKYENVGIANYYNYELTCFYAQFFPVMRFSLKLIDLCDAIKIGTICLSTSYFIHICHKSELVIFCINSCNAEIKLCEDFVFALHVNFYLPTHDNQQTCDSTSLLMYMVLVLFCKSEYK